MIMKEQIAKNVREMRNNAILLTNRFLNRRSFKKKVFCIGLHKAGTTSLYRIAVKYGYKATHSTNWINDPQKLEKYDFFCDGGSHFDDQNEFDFKRLFYDYPDSLFILQKRDSKKWVISKLKHAGWNKQTVVEVSDERYITHGNWRYKSLLTIENFIKHKYNYEQKVTDFFKANNPHRLLTIDITDKKKQLGEYARLVTFLELSSISKVSLPHLNKMKSDGGLSEQVLAQIDKTIAANESERTNKAKHCL